MILLALIASALTPQTYQRREVAGWDVQEADNGEGCHIGMEYEGDGSSLLLLTLPTDDSKPVLLALANYNWSIKDDEETKLTYLLDSGGYADKLGIGISSDGRRGFASAFEKRFPEYFASSSGLTVKRGDVIVDDLRLKGSGAAIAAARQCVATIRIRDAAEAREKKRLEHITKDPFAKQD